MPANTYGRQVVIALTNKSGASVAAGDVVVIDTTTDDSFTTTTTARAEISLGVAQETIASNAAGRVLTSGYAALINVPASVTRGHYIETHTVVKQATGSATRRSGSFGQFGKTSATPSGWIWGNADQAGAGGSVATDTIWDAKGDLAVGTGADTASKLTVGTNGFVLTADSAQATGTKWAAASSGVAQLGRSIVPVLYDASWYGYVASATQTFSTAELAAWMPWTDTNAYARGWLSNGTLPATVQIQLPAAATVAKYGVTPWVVDTGNTRWMKTWTFEGSNDGAAWTTLDTQTNFATGSWAAAYPTPAMTLFTIASPGSYSYYKWVITANQGNAYTGICALGLFV